MEMEIEATEALKRIYQTAIEMAPAGDYTGTPEEILRAAQLRCAGVKGKWAGRDSHTRAGMVDAALYNLALAAHFLRHIASCTTDAGKQRAQCKANMYLARVEKVLGCVAARVLQIVPAPRQENQAQS